MAPKKRRVAEEEPRKPKLPMRVTRSAAKRAVNTNSVDFVSEAPRTDVPKKKAKKVVNKEEQGNEISKAAKTKTIVIEHWLVSCSSERKFVNYFFWVGMRSRRKVKL